MFKKYINKYIDKWKKEWLVENKLSLEKEFNDSLQSQKIEFQSKIQSEILLWKKQEEEVRRNIESKSEELKYMEERLLRRKEELERESDNLKEQIRLIEAKSSPSSIWENAVQTGWLMAWNSMIPIVNDSILKQKSFIEQTAIEDTLKRMAGRK